MNDPRQPVLSFIDQDGENFALYLTEPLDDLDGGLPCDHPSGLAHLTQEEHDGMPEPHYPTSDGRAS